MAWMKCGAAMLAAGVLAAQPCSAASDYRYFRATERNASAFAGFNVRMPLGQAQKTKPTARLQFTTAYKLRDGQTGDTLSFKGQGLEIGAASAGKPILYLNGQKMAEMRERLHAKGSPGSTLLIVGGVLLVLVVAAAVAAGNSGLGDTCPEYEGSNDHCID